MVSTPVIHVITTHLPTPADGRLSWPGWLTQRTLYSQWHAVYCCMFRKRQTLSRRQKKELTENRDYVKNFVKTKKVSLYRAF